LGSLPNRINRKLKSSEVIDVLAGLFILLGVPEHIRAANSPEFVTKAVKDWIATVGARTAYVEPWRPRKNGYNEASTSASVTS
jgi:hypothetical protein